YTNPRSYPLASYSYLIVPREGTQLPTNFTKAKGRTLAAFAVFALCRGQRDLGKLGYAPLPPALVHGGLVQAAHIPGHGPIPTPHPPPRPPPWPGRPAPNTRLSHHNRTNKPQHRARRSRQDVPLAQMGWVACWTMAVAGLQPTRRL